MDTKLVFTIILTTAFIPAIAQRPDRSQGPPPGDGSRRPDWTRGIDTNKNGTVETDEFQAAIDRTFAEIDRNGNGVIEKNEAPPPHPPHDGMGPGQHPGGPPMPGMGRGRPGPPPGQPGGDGFGQGGRPGPPNGDMSLLPPFFFEEKLEDGGTLTKADFERAAKDVFASMDANHDGVLSREESQPKKGNEGAPPPPHGIFIAAELRFGDKLVKDQPFSAETVIEDTRLLFDGSLVKKEIRGNIYRDGSGRTRREMPLGMVGGVNILGADKKPQLLVFINDFGAKIQYFLDQNNKIARKHRLKDGGEMPPDGDMHPEAKTTAEGTKMIEGVSCVGTRTEFEIPAGEIGNDKPLKVIDEKWYSPELQVVVMSIHNDPVSGTHVFKLVNIKRIEPAPELFTVPSGFKIEGPPDKDRQ